MTVGVTERNLVRTPIAIPVSATLVFAGLVQPLDVTLFAKSPVLIQMAALLIWVAPVLPLAIVVLRRVRPKPASPEVIRFVAIAVSLVGLILTLAEAAAASPHGTLLSLIHGSVITLAVASSLLSLAIGRIGPRETCLAVSGMVLAATAATWSLLSVPSVVVQANRLSAGDPFCISRHGPSPDIGSVWDLRGFSFYTTQSGYKSTSGWYFHGTLIVEGRDGRQYFNWSPRRFRFDRVAHPDRFIAPLLDLCAPSAAFWVEL